MAIRFVVVGTQRSGTTLVRQCLDSHPAVLCRGELFARSYGKPDGYRRYRFASTSRQLGHLFWRGRQVKRFLRERLQPPPGVAAIGFKLMRSQVRRFPYWYPMVLDFMHAEQLQVIHVVRRNLLRIAVSRRTARLRGQFHAREAVAPVRLTLPVESLKAELAALERENAFWEEVMRELPSLQVEYETFVQERHAEARRMLEFLGVDPTVVLRSPHERLNRVPLTETIENFEDVRRCLAGSPWAVFLAD